MNLTWESYVGKTRWKICVMEKLEGTINYVQFFRSAITLQSVAKSKKLQILKPYWKSDVRNNSLDARWYQLLSRKKGNCRIREAASFNVVHRVDKLVRPDQFQPVKFKDYFHSLILTAGSLSATTRHLINKVNVNRVV